MKPFPLQSFVMTMMVALSYNGTFTEGEVLRIGIAHWNDVSGQMERFTMGTGSSTAAPQPCSSVNETCIGGVVSLVHHIHEPFGIDVNASLRLGAGNVVGGESGWVASYGLGAYNAFIRNHFKPDALALGMNEFGNGVEAATAFIDAINFDGKDGSVVLANSCEYPEDYTQPEPEFQFCEKIAKIKKVPVKETGHKIGVIGFVTPTVERHSLPGRLEFYDVAAAVQDTIAENSDLRTFIAIGDGSLEMAKGIIDTSPGVKLVIFGAGFSNTPNMTEEGEYPLSYKNSWIATAGKYGSSIGKLVLSWDTATGNFEVEPKSKLVVTTRPEIMNAEGDVARRFFNTQIQPVITGRKEDILGHTLVPMEGGESCWRSECNLGNLVTDAMVQCVLLSLAKNYNHSFPFPIHSILHAGAFSDDVIEPSGNVSRFDIFKWFPYHNQAYLVNVTGRDLKKLFEESAKAIISPGKAGLKDWAQFLQVSRGMEVHYEVGGSGGPKLGGLRMTHLINGIPRKEEVQDGRGYYLVVPTFLYEGRGVYEFARGIWNWTLRSDSSGVPVTFKIAEDCVPNYVTVLKEIGIGLEERIWIGEESGGGAGPSPSTDSPGGPTTDSASSEEDINPPPSSLPTESPCSDQTTSGGGNHVKKGSGVIIAFAILSRLIHFLSFGD